MIKALLFVRIRKIGSVKIGQCLFLGNALLRFCQMRRKNELHFVVLQWCASWRIIMIRKYKIKYMYFRFVSWLIPKIHIHVLPWIVYANFHTILISKKRRTVLSAELFIDMLLIITFCPCRAFLGRVAQELGISFATSGSVSFRCKTRKFLDELSYCARNRRSVSKGRRKHNRRKMPFSVLV